MLFIYLAMIDDDTQRSKFEYIYHTYYGMMYKVAYELTKDQRLAEDAVHETMVNIIEDIDTIRMDNPKELKSYLYLVTKSKTIDFIRRCINLSCLHDQNYDSTVGGGEYSGSGCRGNIGPGYF